MQTSRTQQHTSNHAFVPADPFRRIVENWLAREERGWTLNAASGTNTHPSVLLCETLWPKLKKQSAQRRLNELRSGRQREIAFDLADRIICKLLQSAFLWLTDPELAEIYQNVNLFSVDVQWPTCLEAAAHTSRIIRNAVEVHGSYTAATRALGLNHRRVAAAAA